MINGLSSLIISAVCNGSPLSYQHTSIDGWEKYEFLVRKKQDTLNIKEPIWAFPRLYTNSLQIETIAIHAIYDITRTLIVIELLKGNYVSFCLYKSTHRESISESKKFDKKHQITTSRKYCLIRDPASIFK